MSLLPQSIFVVADVFMRTSAVYIYAESASIQRGVAISGARVTMRPFFSPKKKSSVSLLRGTDKRGAFLIVSVKLPIGMLRNQKLISDEETLLSGSRIC